MYRTDFWTLWEKARVGCFERTTSKHVYYLGWNRSPAQVGCMRQALGPGALGRPRGIGWRGRWKGGLGWGTHVTPWLIHVNVWQKPLQYCKVISLQLIKINGKIKKKFFKPNKQKPNKNNICLKNCKIISVRNLNAKSWIKCKFKLKKKWLSSKTWETWEFLESPEVRTWSFHCQGPDSIPGQRTKIPHTEQH